jgi:hypothetical protein
VAPAAARGTGKGAGALTGGVVVAGGGVPLAPVVLTAQPLVLEFKRVGAEPPKLEATPNHMELGGPIEVGLQLAPAQAQLSFGPLTPPEWTAQVAFPDSGEGAEKGQIQILLDSIKLGGMALSVGAVWWASRVSGLLGGLLASTPAWRHIDPLPVVGRDEDQDKEWYEGDDLEADADELAVSLVLEGSRRVAAEEE